MDGPLLQCTCHQVHIHAATAHSHTKEQKIECRAKLLPDQRRPCKRHYTRCKPSRRKSPLWRSMAEIWTILSKLMICLHGFVHNGICTEFLRGQRTKQSGVPLRLWVIIFLLAVFLPFPLCEADPLLQPSPSSQSDQLHNVLAPVGSAFVYAIPERAFDCKVDKFVVSETADRFLSTWLTYDDDKRQVYGVPSEKDLGTFNVLVVALTKSEIENVGRICGSKSFAITVISLGDELPVSANLADPSRTNPLHFQQTATAADMLCTPGMQVVLGTVLVSVNIHSLNGHERMSTILKMAGHLNTSTRKVSMFSGESSHPLILQLERPSLLTAGAGDGRFAKGPKSLLTWRITCGAIGLRDAALSQLEASTQDGTISSLLGFPVVSWHVMSGTQKSVSRRVRRNVGGRCLGCTPTPSTSSAPPTRLSNVSTTVIVNKTVTSIITSSSVMSLSVMPAVNSTVLSRSMTVSTRTISPTPSMNATVQASTSSVATRNSSVFSSPSVSTTVASAALPTSVTRASKLSQSTMRPLDTAAVSSSRSRSASVSHASLTTSVQVGVSLSSSPGSYSQLSRSTVTRSFATANLSSVEIIQTTSLAHNATSVVVSTARGTSPGKNSSTRTSFAVGETTPAPSQSVFTKLTVVMTLNSTGMFVTSTSVARNRTAMRPLTSSTSMQDPSTTSNVSIPRSKSSPVLSSHTGAVTEIPSSVVTISSAASNATSVISLIQSSAATPNISVVSPSFAFTTTTVRSLRSSVSAVNSTILLPSSSVVSAATTTVLKSTASSSVSPNATALFSPVPSSVTFSSTVALPSLTVASSVTKASLSNPSLLVTQSSSVVRRSRNTNTTVLAPTQTVKDSSSRSANSTFVIRSSFSSAILVASSSTVADSTSEPQSLRTSITTILRPSASSSLRQLVTDTFLVSHSRSVSPSLSIPSNTTSKPSSSSSRSTQASANSTLDSHRTTALPLTTVRPSRTRSVVTRLTSTFLISNTTLEQSATRSLDSSSVLVSVNTSSVLVSATYETVLSSSTSTSSMPIRSSSVGENSTLETRSRSVKRSVTSVLEFSFTPSTLQSTLTQAENSSTFPVSSSAAVISSSVVPPSPSSADKTFSQTSLTGSSINVMFSSETENTSTLMSSTPVVTNSTRVTKATPTLAVTPTLPATRNVSIATSTTGFMIDSTRMRANETVITHSQPLISTSPALSTVQSTRTVFASSARTSATPARSVNISRVSTVTISVLTNVSTSAMLFKTSAKTSSAAETLSSSEMTFSSSLVDSKMFNSTAATPVGSSTVVRVSSSLISSPVSLTTESFVPTVSRATSLVTNSTSRTSVIAPSTSFKLATSESAEKRRTITVVTRTVRTTSALPSPTSLPTSVLNVSSSRESTPAHSLVTNSTADSKITSISTVAGISTRIQSAITRSTTPVLDSTARTSFLSSPSSLVTTTDATRSVDANLTSLRATHSTVASTHSSVVAVANSSSMFVSEASTRPVETSLSTTGLKPPSSGSATDVTKAQTSSRTSFITPTTASVTGAKQTADSTTGLFSPSVLTHVTAAFTSSGDVTSLKTDLLTSTAMTSATLSRNASVFMSDIISALSTMAVTPYSTFTAPDVSTSPSLNTSVTQSRIVTQGSVSSSPVSQHLFSSASESDVTMLSSHVTSGASYTTDYASPLRPRPSSSLVTSTFTIVTPSSVTVSPITSRKAHDASSTGVTLAPSSASVVPSRVHSNVTITSVPSLSTSSDPVISSVTRQVPSSHRTSVITKVASSTEHSFASHSFRALSDSRVSSSHHTSVITKLQSSAQHTVFTMQVLSASYDSRVSSSHHTSVITKLPPSAQHFIFTSPVSSASYVSRVSSSHHTSVITKLPSSAQHSIFTSPVPIFASPSSSQQSSKSTQLMSSVTSVSFVVGATSLGVPSSVLTSTVTATNTTSLTPTPTSTTTVRPTAAPPNTGPVLVNNLGRVTARVGKALNYPIPNDTFYDQEDGDTWHLKLRVTYLDNKAIPGDYWLQFDPRERRLYGLPSEKDAEVLGADGEEFVLVASDKNGKKAYDAFGVLIDRDSPPAVQHLSIRTSNNYSKFNANVSLRLQLLDKIATYYGDSDNTYVRVLSISPGSVIFVWTNDSLPTSECDVERADYIASKVFLENGEVKPEFTQALEPEFPVLTASEARLGACNATDVKPTDPIRGKASKSASDLWYMHVLTGILVVVLLIIIAALLVRWLRRKKPKPFKPEKRTYKKRKPIILNPEIEMKEFPGKPLVLPNDDPSQPPSYMSETSLDRSPYSDEEDYAKRSPSPPIYEPPPPFYPTMDEPRSFPPPMYSLPPLIRK